MIRTMEREEEMTPRHVARFVGWLAVSISLLALDRPAALACTMVCVAPSVERSFQPSDRVLVGRVTTVSHGTDGRSTFTLQVIRSWKGPGSAVTLSTYGGGPSCGKQLLQGEVYFAFLGKGQKEIDICSTVGGIWELWAKRAVTTLDRMYGLPALDLPAAQLRAPWERK